MEQNKNTFICPCCGEVYDSWPALAFGTPSPYHGLPPHLKNSIAKINSDFCIIQYEDQTDRFIRCVLNMDIIGSCRKLEYGIWVSLSEKSFMDYQEHFMNEDHEATYFAWISNLLPDYEDTTRIPASVVLRQGGMRPEIFPREDFDHQFVRDYYQGIPMEEAERRIEQLMMMRKLIAEQGLPKN